MERCIHIPKVPLWLRQNKAYSECFDPAVVSIGPYHHGNPNLARIEELKIISARRFVAFSGLSIEYIYSKLESLTSEAKKYYDDSIMAKFDDEAFTIMMLLDGCFIFYFILQVGLGRQWNLLIGLKNGECNRLLTLDTPLIFRDLLLLDNQLPCLILNELMNCFRVQGPYDELMNFNNVVHGYIDSEMGKTYGMPSSPSVGQNRVQLMRSLPYILDLFRVKLIGDKPIFHFLPRLPRSKRSEQSKHSERSKRSYPPVKELLAMGITFKRKNSICLCDVEFRTHLLSGELLLPQIEINHYTKDRFLNLIAYELSYDNIEEHAFIAFICFLDTLIDHADDVKVLRSEGIICNYLGSDEEVANLVNQLATGLILEPSAYSEVVHEIQSHLQKKWRVDIGEIKHTHFRSLLTIIALIVAGYVILLTSIQTVFTIFPR